MTYTREQCVQDAIVMVQREIKYALKDGVSAETLHALVDKAVRAAPKTSDLENG